MKPLSQLLQKILEAGFECQNREDASASNHKIPASPFLNRIWKYFWIWEFSSSVLSRTVLTFFSPFFQDGNCLLFF